MQNSYKCIASICAKLMHLGFLVPTFFFFYKIKTQPRFFADDGASYNVRAKVLA